MEKMNLKLIEVSKSYNDRAILDHFSLEFKTGSVTCLFGPSGCGKTTLLNLIGGVIKAYMGYSLRCRQLSPEATAAD
jgi:NitT/TauT family transport system ATP-binding protein